MKARIKLLTDTARVPTYATDGSAAFDIYADECGRVGHGYVKPIKTGVSFEVPDGHVLKVYPRSGLSFKNGVRLANCTAIIDSDYRGELMVALTSDAEGFTIAPGDRIAQGIIIPIEKTEFEIVEELSETVRGNNGLGSTGQ